MEGAYLDVVPRDWSLPGLEAQRIMQPASDSDLGKCTNVFFIGMGPKITCHIPRHHDAGPCSKQDSTA